MTNVATLAPSLVNASPEQLAAIANILATPSTVVTQEAPVTRLRDGVIAQSQLGVPLKRVSYTSKAGNTATYGVFWHGVKNGEERFGLCKIKNNGRLYRPSAFAPRFFVATKDCVVLS